MDKKLYPRIGEEVIWVTLDNADPAVAFSDERMQADGEQHRADAVDQIERPPHEAGAL